MRKFTSFATTILILLAACSEKSEPKPKPAPPDPRVAALVAPRGDRELTLAAVQDDARKYIAGYKVPRELHIVPEIPRAPSGKPAYPKALEIALSGEHRVA